LSIRFLLPIAAAVVACLSLAGVALAQSPSPSPSATATPPVSPTAVPPTTVPTQPAQCPDVAISAKATGSTVAVTLVPANVNIKPPTAGDLNSFHLHYFVDLDPATIIVPGQPLPPPGANPSIIHSPELSMTFSSLAAGDHTVWVVMGRLNHVPCAGGVQAVVKFTVPKAPATGTGPATSDDTGLYAWVIVAGIALLATGTVAGARAIKR
jgi:hypothetical protein